MKSKFTADNAPRNAEEYHQMRTSTDDVISTDDKTSLLSHQTGLRPTRIFGVNENDFGLVLTPVEVCCFLVVISYSIAPISAILSKPFLSGLNKVGRSRQCSMCRISAVHFPFILTNTLIDRTTKLSLGYILQICIFY